MRSEHDGPGCRVYPFRCDRCRQIRDRWDTVKIVFCLLVFFTGVIPVVPMVVAIIMQVT